MKEEKYTEKVRENYKKRKISDTTMLEKKPANRLLTLFTID